jgi:hypothetical protein
MKRRVIILVVVAVVAVAALIAYKEFNRKNPRLDSVKPDLSVGAASMCADFAADANVAGQKYIGKVVQIKGRPTEWDMDNKVIVFADSLTQISIRCSLDTAVMGNNLTTSDSRISVTGFCTGFNEDELIGSDIILTRTIINHN